MAALTSDIHKDPRAPPNAKDIFIDGGPLTHRAYFLVLSVREARGGSVAGGLCFFFVRKTLDA
jgi:hypothetical protein